MKTTPQRIRLKKTGKYYWTDGRFTVEELLLRSGRSRFRGRDLYGNGVVEADDPADLVRQMNRRFRRAFELAS